MKVDRSRVVELLETVPQRTGWDFHRVRSHSGSSPWDYEAVVRTSLDTGDHVLDLDTGGGERFVCLAAHFASGVGTDASADLVALCRRNLPAGLAGKLRFVQTDARDLSMFATASFTKVLNRHGVFDVSEVERVLKPGGTFVTQQVGERNTQKVFEAFGYRGVGDYWEQRGAPMESWNQVMDRVDTSTFRVLRNEEYDIPFYFDDLDSFVFWLKGVEIPYPFDPLVHVDDVMRFLASNWTPAGIRTNEHRRLLILGLPSPGDGEINSPPPRRQAAAPLSR